MKMTKRLLRLEARFGSMAQAMQKAAVPSGAQLIAERLASFGIVRGPNESLAETTARAMGISVRELRAELQRRAAGFATGKLATDIAK